jgi:CheY-like chemotaxis protein
VGDEGTVGRGIDGSSHHVSGIGAVCAWKHSTSRHSRRSSSTINRRCATMLETLGFGRIVRVGNGRDALSAVIASDTPFDLIRSDLQIPGSDGVATLHAWATPGVTSWLIVTSVEERRRASRNVDERRIIESVGLSSRKLGLRMLGSVRIPIQLDELRACIQRMATSDRVRELPSQLAPKTHSPKTSGSANCDCAINRRCAWRATRPACPKLRRGSGSRDSIYRSTILVRDNPGSLSSAHAVP